MSSFESSILASDSGQVKVIYLLFFHLKKLEGYYLTHTSIYTQPVHSVTHKCVLSRHLYVPVKSNYGLSYLARKDQKEIDKNGNMKSSTGE
jgi:hypothetical protein